MIKTVSLIPILPAPDCTARFDPRKNKNIAWRGGLKQTNKRDIINSLLTKLVRSRLLDISLVLFRVLWAYFSAQVRTLYDGWLHFQSGNLVLTTGLKT